MAGCCGVAGCDIFDEGAARRDLRSYRRKGLDRVARRIVAVLAERGLGGQQVLEVGGGIGALQLELLRAGASRVTNVELSPAYEAAAGELLREAGVAERGAYVVADFALEAAGLGPADAVVLHRVVCCYPDGEALVRAAAGTATRFVAMSLPPSAWWIRLAVAVQNVWHRLRSRSYRTYVHSPAALVAVARSRGFEPVLDHRGPVWRLLVLEAVPPRSGAASVTGEDAP